MSKAQLSNTHSSSSGAVYSSSRSKDSKDSKATGRGDNWIKVSSRSDTIEMDTSLFTNQPINPFNDSKRSSNTQSSRTNPIYVQDSGLVISSRTGSHQSLSSTTSGSSNGSIENVDSPKAHIASRLEGSQPSKADQGLEDEWEIVYPDD